VAKEEWTARPRRRREAVKDRDKAAAVAGADAER